MREHEEMKAEQEAGKADKQDVATSITLMQAQIAQLNASLTTMTQQIELGSKTSFQNPVHAAAGLTVGGQAFKQVPATGQGSYSVEVLGQFAPKQARDESDKTAKFYDYYTPTMGESGYIIVGSVNHWAEYRYMAMIYYSAAEGGTAGTPKIVVEEKVHAYMAEFQVGSNRAIQVKNTYNYELLLVGVVHRVFRV